MSPCDDIVRTLSQRLSEIWSQAVVVQSRGGAGGNIGAEALAEHVRKETVMYAAVIKAAKISTE